MTEMMKTTVPFSGFYNSHHDARMDDTLQQLAHDWEDGEIDFDELFGKVSWPFIHEKYAKAFVDHLAGELDAPLTFSELWSPREYNFETDRIFCEVPKAWVLEAFEEVDKDDLAAKVRDKFSDRSGFFSFYSPHLADWGPVETWDLNQVGTLVEVLAEAQDFDPEAELEDVFCNGHFENWVYESIRIETARRRN